MSGKPKRHACDDQKCPLRGLSVTEIRKYPRTVAFGLRISRSGVPYKRGPHLFGKARRFDAKWLPIYLERVCRNLRDARLERDIGICELSAASGITASAICRIEKIRSSRGSIPDALVSTIIRLAVAMGLSPSEVMP